MSGDVFLRVGRCAGQPGLTLVEFLFAISVIAITSLGVAGMFPAALRSVASGGQVTKATVLAQSMAEMIRNDPFDTLVTRYNNLNTSTDTTLRTLTCPVIPSGYDPDYNKKKWKCDIAATTAQLSGRGLPSGYGTVFVACLNNDGTTNSTVPCPGDRDLRRVTVTVTWDALGSRSVSLVTYVARTE